jgi:dethiobiotin synthetase
LSLDEINPWSFRAPLAPLLAARRERRKVRKNEVVKYIRRFVRDFDTVLIEGAGGLLSPLGEGFDSRDLIVSLMATPLIVVPNRLGAVNQARLTLEALPRFLRAKAQVVLMNPRRADAASRSNPELVSEFLAHGKVHEFPWLTRGQMIQLPPAAIRVVRKLVQH